MRAKTAVKQIPINRSGSEMSQTIGNNTSASTASGHHRTNRIHQATNRISAFIPLLNTSRPQEVTDFLLFELIHQTVVTKLIPEQPHGLVGVKARVARLALITKSIFLAGFD